MRCLSRGELPRPFRSASYPDRDLEPDGRPAIQRRPATTALAPPFVVWARASLLGLAMVGSGAVSHVSAGGLLPHPVAMLVLIAASTMLAGRFLLGPASARRIVVLVVMGQTLTHTLLSALAGHHGDARTTTGPPPIQTPTLPVNTDGRRLGSLQDAYHAGPTGVSPPSGSGHAADWAAHQLHHLAEQGPLMVFAHVAAAVALGLWLAVGEGALWALIHLAAACVAVAAAAGSIAVTLLAARRGISTTVRPQPHTTGFTPVPRLDRPALSRRGPPALLAP